LTLSILFSLLNLLTLLLIDLLEDVSELLGKHGIAIARLPLLVHILPGQTTAIQLPLHHSLSTLGATDLIKTFGCTLLAPSAAILDRGHCQCPLFFLVLIYGLLIVLLFHLAEVLKVVLEGDHLVMGYLVEILALAFVFLSERVILSQILLLKLIDCFNRCRFTRFKLLQIKE